MNNNEELNDGIAKFYDASSRLWEDMWGEHMHHGFYEPGLPLFSALSVDHRAAQVRMIEESLRWASIPGNNIFFISSLCHLCLSLGFTNRYGELKHKRRELRTDIEETQKACAELSSLIMSSFVFYLPLGLRLRILITDDKCFSFIFTLRFS